MCFQINWYYQTLNILWEQFNEFPNAFNKTVVLSNCFRQAILVCIYCMEQNSFCCYIQTYITILEMSQKQIKIIPLKLLDNKLFKFLILSFKISIDNVIHFCSLGGIMFAPVNGLTRQLPAQQAHLPVQLLNLTIRGCHATWRAKVNYIPQYIFLANLVKHT